MDDSSPVCACLLLLCWLAMRGETGESTRRSAKSCVFCGLPSPVTYGFGRSRWWAVLYRRLDSPSEVNISTNPECGVDRMAKGQSLARTAILGGNTRRTQSGTVNIVPQLATQQGVYTTTLTT